MDPAQERDYVLSVLRSATIQLEESLDNRLIPPEGLSFGFAIRGARDSGGIAAVTGGIKNGAGSKATAGPCAVGTDEPLARVILTILRFNPAMRSAAIIRFSDRALKILENDLFLECALPGTMTKNQGIGFMDWDIASCCKDGIPDVIVMKRAGPDESRIVLTGEKPADVANNIIICSNRISNSAL